VGEDLPTLLLSAEEVGHGVTVAHLFARAGLAKSGKEAKRLIAEGGARLNDETVLDPAMVVGAGMLAEPLKLTAGRKRHALVVLG
jgi:tyrosyl-tRNA synthetase